MNPHLEQHEPLRFSVGDLLVTFAVLCALLGGGITLAKLDDTSATWNAVSSDIETLDGSANAVVKRVAVSTESGIVVTPEYVRSLQIALLIELSVVGAAIVYAFRRQRSRTKTAKPDS